jgi:hypothetical protein
LLKAAAVADKLPISLVPPIPSASVALPLLLAIMPVLLVVQPPSRQPGERLLYTRLLPESAVVLVFPPLVLVSTDLLLALMQEPTVILE